MPVVHHESPAAFRAVVGPYLFRDEARRNLLFGLLHTLATEPTAYPASTLWSVEEEGRVVGGALMRPPHRLVLAASPLPRNRPGCDARYATDSFAGRPRVRPAVQDHGHRGYCFRSHRAGQGRARRPIRIGKDSHRLRCVLHSGQSKEGPNDRHTS